MNRCTGCAFYESRPLEPCTGVCHALPPNPTFPIVKSHDWCGHWKERPDVSQEEIAKAIISGWNYDDSTSTWTSDSTGVVSARITVDIYGAFTACVLMCGECHSIDTFDSLVEAQEFCDEFFEGGCDYDDQ